MSIMLQHKFLTLQICNSMNNRIFLFIVFVLGSLLQMMAQDDLYFVPSKKKETKKTETISYSDWEHDDWAADRNGVIDVDAYNRRGYANTNEDVSYDEPANGTESLTNRIIRFHSPGITIISSPYYTDYIDIYTDPWYSFYRPYSWYSYNWYSSWWWDYPYYWSSSCYYPWWGWHGHYHPTYYHGHHHAWHPHYGGHHHQYYPRRDYTHRPTTASRGYRPSTDRGVRPSANRSQRPSAERPTSTNRRSTAIERTERQPSQKREGATPSRDTRKSSPTTVSPSRNQRTPQRSMGTGGGGSRPQRSMGGSGGGRRR